jgi:uroporphyrinogen-III synthase
LNPPKGPEEAVEPAPPEGAAVAPLDSPVNWIVTRPAGQAAAWVDELRALGQIAHALPLIGIAPVSDPEPVRQAWVGLDTCSLVVFVSANAAEHFFALRPAGLGWPVHTLAGSTGPGTSAALTRLGQGIGLSPSHIVDPGPEAEALDSESLWARLQSRGWQGRRVRVVRGEDGRDWLAETLRSAGASVDFVAAYRREPPVLSLDGQRLLAAALARPQRHVWLFSSSEAVGHLGSLAPFADWSAGSAIASHPRIVEAASRLGFRRIGLAPSRPAEVLACALKWAADPPIVLRPQEAGSGSGPIQSNPL